MYSPFITPFIIVHLVHIHPPALPYNFAGGAFQGCLSTKRAASAPFPTKAFRTPWHKAKPPSGCSLAAERDL